MPERIDPNVTELVRLAKAGDRDAYDRLFGAAADRVLAFIRLRLGKKLRADQDSLDVLQEAYLAAHRAFSTFESGDSKAFFRWLCQIVETTIRGLADFAGAAKRRAPGERERLSAVIDRARSMSGPASQAMKKDDHRQLADALETLDPANREIVLLRFFVGLSTDVIAATIDLPETTVRRTCAKAVLRLGDLLKIHEERPS